MDSEKKEITTEILTSAIVNMATESWRIIGVCERLLAKLDVTEQNRYKNQFRWFLKKIEDSLESMDMKFVNIEGQPYDIGMAATPLNIEEFSENDLLVVEKMLEPIIMGRGNLVKLGTVTLRRIEK